jgi:hypothetical protein
MCQRNGFENLRPVELHKLRLIFNVDFGEHGGLISGSCTGVDCGIILKGISENFNAMTRIRLNYMRLACNHVHLWKKWWGFRLNNYREFLVGSWNPQGWSFIVEWFIHFVMQFTFFRNIHVKISSCQQFIN